MRPDKATAVARGMNCIGGGKLLECELEWLYDLAEMAPDGPAVEVGCFRGKSLVCWACARIGRGEIWATDIKERPELWENIDAFDADYGLRLWFARGNSWEVADKVLLDHAFCFIDADHGIDGFPKDILPWAAKMMPGGIIVFHDYGVWKPTVVVKRYVDAWQSMVNWELIGQERSSIAFRRPDPEGDRAKRQREFREAGGWGQ